MRRRRKSKSSKELQEAFFKKAGEGIRTLKALMDTLPMVAFYLKDAQGRIMALNPLNCEICGIRNEHEVIGFKSSDLFPPPLAETYMARDRKVLQTGRPIIGELNTRTADRSPNPRRTNTFPIFGPGGRIIGTAGAIHLATDAQIAPVWHDRQRLSPAINHIEKHYAEGISVPDVARLVRMSPTHFRRCFKDTIGCTPVRYLQTVRINAARHLLETTNKLIADIAQETGFSDHAHFIRTFLALRKTTPGEYRLRHMHLTDAPRGGSLPSTPLPQDRSG